MAYPSWRMAWPRMVLISVLMASGHAWALMFPLPPPGEHLVGELQYTHVSSGETLMDVARRFDVGYYELLAANPRLKKRGRLKTDSKIIIPSLFILPNVPRRGIVINLAEFRLYYYLPGESTVLTEPVGIGRVGWNTPIGVTRIVRKKKDPSWRPTPRVRAEAKRRGYDLPAVWPPGKDNPLGQYAMRLAWPSYLIHGTNKPSGIGKRSSAGCIRMFPEDIETLFGLVPVGTPVRVINHPIKVGWRDDQMYLEVHRAVTGGRKDKSAIHHADLVNKVYQLNKHHDAGIHWQYARQVLKRKSGFPVPISDY